MEGKQCNTKLEEMLVLYQPCNWSYRKKQCNQWCVSGRIFLCVPPAQEFSQHRNEMTSKGKEGGGSLWDDSPVCITQLTHCSGVGGHLASESNAAWSRHPALAVLSASQVTDNTSHLRQWLVCTALTNKLSQHLALHSRHVPVPV